MGRATLNMIMYTYVVPDCSVVLHILKLTTTSCSRAYRLQQVVAPSLEMS